MDIQKVVSLKGITYIEIIIPMGMWQKTNRYVTIVITIKRMNRKKKNWWDDIPDQPVKPYKPLLE